MERATQNAHSGPLSTEVGREEKGRIVHQSFIDPNPEPALNQREISRQQLINKLNHINFQDRTVSVVFKHNKYPRTLTLQAHPLPCQTNHLVCSWAEAVDVEQLVEYYQFDCLYVSKGQQLLEVRPEVKGLNDRQIGFRLPETCHEVSERRLHRYQCRGITVYLFQNGALFCGDLMDFCAFQFRIKVRTLPPQTFHWIDADSPVTLVLTKGSETLYSGECRIVKQDNGQQVRHINLEPNSSQVRRFGPREFRSTRQKLNPSPDVVFTHPLFQKSFTLKVLDISGSGFALEEESQLAVLLPGMIIPDLELIFSDGLAVRCLVQVVYSKPSRQGHTGTILRCGLAILDMAVDDHIKLLALLHQASDANAYVCNKVDMETLWDFFFETGFIYPQKYEYIQANKEQIKATYEKLYHMSPSIASHFIYQENGRILAHMAMVRFYETSWLIHHHAAIRSSYNRGGLMVLNQVGRFINDSHRLHSMKMEYVYCYYRPDNKFPSHVFGGAARNVRNPRICSLDTFAYFHQRNGSHSKADLPSAWQLEPAQRADLHDLQTYYEDNSGGLMLSALHLDPDKIDCSNLAEEYHAIGLKRDRHIFALRHREKLSAVIVVNIADLGLNMSDLTNSVKFIVVNGRHLTSDLVMMAVNAVTHYFEHHEIPVLLYPQQTADQLGMDYEKSYCLWAYHTQNLDPYFRFLKRLLKFIQH